VSHAGLVWLGEVVGPQRPDAGLSEVLAEAPRRRHDPGVGLAQLVLTLTTWCAIEVGTCWPANLGWWWSAAGCPVGDQPGDGQVGLGVVLPPPDPALQHPPLLMLGVGMLDADPLGRLLRARLLPGGQLLG
jgi:hypothetical protein